MSTRQLTSVATDTARSIRRRLAVVARARSRGGHDAGWTRPRDTVDRLAEPPAPGTKPSGDRGAGDCAPERAADDARLDALRGDLVRELDRLAFADRGCSASFRRI
jgi:hypothetical protein